MILIFFCRIEIRTQIQTDTYKQTIPELLNDDELLMTDTTMAERQICLAEDNGPSRPQQRHAVCPATSDIYVSSPATSDIYVSSPATSDIYVSSPATSDSYVSSPATSDNYVSTPATSNKYVSTLPLQ